jgi:hypothetical protein
MISKLVLEGSGYGLIEVLSQNLFGRSEEKHEKPVRIGWSRSIFKLVTYQIQVRCVRCHYRRNQEQPAEFARGHIRSV